ncbi:myocardin-related transcription factor A-like isoform X1 [Micropterus dolomieu]|uniref:myocardin-related transcription factor A-like isoform X1 n=1 Tax=Micropterus dolomieu TaxID=147949 RepID=UPI001E8ED4DD|nr:myocardin-related transcription factor A-like isoform X1 [Micropterus dolomieu]XP_045929994.1 myocardin-related transcription factor A-like isoform X1 [Micropterus dolomieu]XP_045930003.1 myocardin-related transcription factor A-like isoform X1 [Micropterus dolomieu]
METKFGERPNANASIPSPQSEAVANELQELSLQPASSVLPVRERKNVLQLKLQQRRSREELVNQGIMPPLKSSAAFHEHRRSLERARTEDYLKRKIRSRPERSELIRMHILEETSAEPSLQAKQLQLKRARLADDLNDKISHRPGPMELIHKNILPVHNSIKQAIIETQFTKLSGDNSSCDEDSNYSLSPEQPVSQESPLGLVPVPSPPETLAGSSVPSPTQVPPSVPPLPPISGSSPSLKLTNGIAAPFAQRTGATLQIKSQPKPNSDRSNQRHKKPKDNKPKIKKLKYHQYIPPDQKGDKEPPPHLDSSYAKILHQQQLFLQLQILSQQQQHYNYHTILPAPPKPQTDQQPSSSSSSSSTATSTPPRPAPSTAPPNLGSHSRQSTAPLGGTKPASLPPNLDEMKVAELKSELKLRSLPVSGTKNDLIERLRTYQELNGVRDTTSSPTAGGTTGPGAEGAGKSSNTAATTNNITSQQQFQCHQTSSMTAGAGSSATPAAATPQQLMSNPIVSLPPFDCLPAAMSPEDTSFNSDPLGEMMSSPLTQLSLQPHPTAQLAKNIKEEPNCSTPAPCQFSLKPASLQKHCPVSSAAPNTTTTAPVVTMDKDKMLQEKDKQIEELTRMLMQKQRLVDVLRMQLEHGKRGGRLPEPLVLLRVKQEPPDKPSAPLSFGHPPVSPQPSSVSCEMDVANVTVKEEAIEAEEVVSETTTPLSDAHGLPQTQTQEVQDQIKQMNTQTKQQQHVCLQQTALQLAQQQAIQTFLLQQQHNTQTQQQTIQNRGLTLETQQNLQKLSQQRKKKSHKQQLKLQQQLLQSQQQQQHQQQSKQHQQQMQLKQQILLKQQKSYLQQQNKQQQQTKQLQQIQIQTKIRLKQQQMLTQQKQQAQPQSPQMSQADLNQQSGSGSSFPLDLLKSNTTPTLVTDSNGNHFLIALTSHTTENQRIDAPESKATNHIALQRLQSTPAKLPGHHPVKLPKADNQTKKSMHMGFLKQQKTKPQNGGLQVSVAQPQQEFAHCLSAPPSLQHFFKDQETASSGKNTSSPPSQIEVRPSLDVLFSPLSPASIKTAASSPDNKDTEHQDFIDIIFQTGEMSTNFKPAPDASLDRLNPHPSASSPPSSPLQLLLSPPIPPSCDTPQSASSVRCELQTLADTTEEKQHVSNSVNGRLEDFLESTTGKPLLGVEPGGLLTLIDDLHSQMLCTPSILNHPSSPMDTFDMAADVEQGLDGMDWLDLTMGGDRGEVTPTLAPLAPQTPPSVFSTDFLDTYDLQIHWDSCL